MEDVHVVRQGGTWNCKDPNVHFLGVFDGHGGTFYIHIPWTCSITLCSLSRVE